MGFDTAGVEHHHAGPEVGEIVAHLEILHHSIVRQNSFQQFAQFGDVPLPIAELINRAILCFLV